VSTQIDWYEKTKHAIRYWLLRRLPTCKQTVEVISQSMERRLTLREQVLLKLHLWVCLWCLWYLEHLQVMRNTMRAHADDPPEMSLPNLEGLSTAARERIKRNITNTK